MMNPIKLFKILAIGNKLEATAKENAPMKVKVPQLLTLLCSLSATIGLPAIITNWVHQHWVVYMGVVVAAIVLHALMPSVFAAPGDAEKKAAGLGGVAGVLLLMLLIPSVASAQSSSSIDGAVFPSAPIANPVSTQPVSQALSADVTNLYAAGVSYNNGATPAISGTGLYARKAADKTYLFTVLDILANTVKPLVVTTNIGVGVAQKVVTIGKVPIYIPSTAGISLNGSNVGWKYDFGALAAMKVKEHVFVLPTVRVLKSSVSNGTGLQPIIGVEVGWGQ